MANKYLNFSISGIGPFDKPFVSKLDFNQLKLALYAANGQGKTTISRMFRLIELGTTADSDTYITKERQSGNFAFESDGKGKAEVGLKRGAGAVVSNTTNYLFHVFNSDYVAENLEINSFIPSGDIQGFIVGKAEIDLAAEKVHLARITEFVEQQRVAIEKAIEAQKDMLKEFGITRRLKEFGDITIDNVMAAPIGKCCYSEKEVQYRALSSIQENTPDIEKLEFPDSDFDLEAMSNLIATRYSKAQFSEDFLELVRNRVKFVEIGMSIQDGEKCPFCGRGYDQYSSALIVEYDKYLNDEEVAIIGQIDAHINRVESVEKRISDLERAAASAKVLFDARKLAFDDLVDKEFPTMADGGKIKVSLVRIKEVLRKKRKDITETINQQDSDDLKIQLDELHAFVHSCNSLIEKINSNQLRAASKKTDIRKSLCNEATKKIRNEENDTIKRLEQSRKEYSNLIKTIKDKEAQGKRDKRAAVGTLLKNLISRMFGEKYTFDPDTFMLILGNSSLEHNADKILSDGEKAVVAFCHYVASTYVLLEKDDDAKNLFFIIDDPISSLDYSFVYKITQVIKELYVTFKTESSRFLTMTHNEAFFNLLVRNNIAKNAFTLTREGISKCKNEIIAPYTGHLQDIHKVAQGGNPTHTTGNSARQVLEALWHFEDPSVSDLKRYLSLEKCSDLASCPSIYLLANDQSHGATVFERGQLLDKTQVREICATIVNHIHNCYPGQLKALGIEWPLSKGEHGVKD